MAKRKAKGKKSNKKKHNIEAKEVEITRGFPMTVVVLGLIVFIVAAVIVMVLTINPSSEGRVVKEINEQERIVETEAKKILSFMNKQDTYSGWIYSDTEPYLIAAAGVSDGSRMSMCNGVEECKVHWWGTPIEAAKFMITMTRFFELDDAKAYYNSVEKAGEELEEDCYVFEDYTALCRKHNLVFTVESEYGSGFNEPLIPVLKDFVLDVYKEIDYWQ